MFRRAYGYLTLILVIFVNTLLFCFINQKPKYCIEKQVLIEKPKNDKNHLTLDFYVNLTEEEFNFEDDVLAQLHIQKTSGSAWENHILNHLQIKHISVEEWKPACTLNPFEKRPACILNRHLRPFIWDRYRSQFCDVHADFTELKNCIMHDYGNRIVSPFILPAFKGVIHFFTFLRNPVHRYISEFEHVKKGATWIQAVRTCKDEELYKQKCYRGDSWRDVTWDEFLSCEHNLANNRQTRMLANYNILGCNVLKCWTKSSSCSPQLKHFYEQKLLQSAKHTLIGLAFFGLTEYQQLAEYLFLKTFNENKFKFSENIKNINETMADASLKNEAKSYIDKIKENNHLDIQLYEFAKTIFLKRVQYFKGKDDTSNS